MMQNPSACRQESTSVESEISLTESMGAAKGIYQSNVRWTWLWRDQYAGTKP